MYNSNLMDLLFNQKYRLDDTGAYSKLDFSKLIFVLEDVDAGSTSLFRGVRRKSPGKSSPAHGLAAVGYHRQSPLRSIEREWFFMATRRAWTASPGSSRRLYW